MHQVLTASRVVFVADDYDFTPMSPAGGKADGAGTASNSAAGSAPTDAADGSPVDSVE